MRLDELDWTDTDRGAWRKAVVRDTRNRIYEATVDRLPYAAKGRYFIVSDWPKVQQWSNVDAVTAQCIVYHLSNPEGNNDQ